MKKRILYITYESGLNTALSISTNINSEIFRSNENILEIYKNERNIVRLFSLIRSVDYIVIVVDGLGSLDKYTLLRILFPNKKILWDYHGPPEELLFHSNSYKTRFIVTIKKIKQKFLANFVHSAICTTESLKEYLYIKLGISSTVISSCLDITQLQSVIKESLFSKVIKINTKEYFIVLWAGGASSSWHALDNIERIAEQIYAKDKQIVFILIGSNPWHKFSFQKNIIFLNDVKYGEYFYLIQQSSICLALYHDTKETFKRI